MSKLPEFVFYAKLETEYARKESNLSFPVRSRVPSPLDDGRLDPLERLRHEAPAFQKEAGASAAGVREDTYIEPPQGLRLAAGRWSTTMGLVMEGMPTAQRRHGRWTGAGAMGLVRYEDIMLSTKDGNTTVMQTVSFVSNDASTKFAKKRAPPGPDLDRSTVDRPDETY